MNILYIHQYFTLPTASGGTRSYDLATSFADVQEIKEKLQNLIVNQENYSIPTEKLIQNHDWKLIAKKYKDFYTNNI